MGETQEAGHAHDGGVVDVGHRAAGSGDPVFDHDGLVGGGIGADLQPERHGWNPEQIQMRVNKDLWYLENWTLWLDVQILFLTIYQVFKGDKNAY